MCIFKRVFETFKNHEEVLIVYRTLEAIFHRPIQILSLLILLPVIALVIAYVMPRSYQATASLWAAYRYEVIGATGPESDLQATPADTQATALTELLQTRTFALTIAHNSNLASTFDSSTRANAQNLENAMFTEISKHVLVVSGGYNLFTISYTSKDPQVAQQVVANTITQFNLQSQDFTGTESTQLLQVYQTELSKAQQQVNAATAKETQYIAAHPGLSPTQLQADPQYDLLETQARDAQTTVENLQATISTIQQEVITQGTSNGGLFRVIDTPGVQPVSRTKLFLTAGGIGLGVGLLAIVLLVVIELRRDRAIYTPADLQKIAPLPVLIQIPYMTKKSLLQLPGYTLPRSA
jgi:uncharacterized protein involved in exopolysaccharide biosynthesis